MYCDNCGAWLDDDTGFCGSCGTPVAKESEESHKSFCGQCGAELDANERFCGRCGALVEDVQNPQTAWQPLQEQEAVSGGDVKKKSGNNAVLVIVITVVTVLVLAGAAFAGYWFIIKDDDGDSDRASITEVRDDEDETDSRKSDDKDKSDKSKSKNKDKDDEPDEKETQKPQRTPKPDSTNKPTEEPERTGDYMYPSDTRYITDEELDEYSQEEVRLILNEIYARHGYIFTVDTYKQYFESKDWYRPSTSSQSEAQSYFNAIEESNRIAIINYETKKGWR